MPSNVVRDGDTVTVRCHDECGITLSVETICDLRDGLFSVELKDAVDASAMDVIVNRDTLAALAYELLVLAGEPDWREIAGKLYRVEQVRRAEFALMRKQERNGVVIDAFSASARSAITEAEWAALEGATE